MSFLEFLPGMGSRGPVRRKPASSVKPTGVERFFKDEEIIVSKTDLKGELTYVNDVFLEISDYTEPEVIGAPHSILRHPDMPRAVFKLLWDQIGQEKEIFAYVVNITKFGDHYWVLAHVTPSLNESGQVVGYHSNRRTVKRSIVDDVIQPLYKTLKAEEEKHGDRKSGLTASFALMNKILEEKGVSYDEFILTL